MSEARSHYDPSLVLPWGEPYFAPTAASPHVISGPAPATYDGDGGYWAGGFWDDPSHKIGPSHDAGHGGGFWGALQDAGHAIEHGLQQAPTFGHTITQAINGPAQLAETFAKANAASDTVTQQANQTAEDARRAISSAEETAKVVKYVAFGIGGLTAIALVVHIIKTATD